MEITEVIVTNLLISGDTFFFPFRELPRWQESEPVCVSWRVFWHPFVCQWHRHAGGPKVSQELSNQRSLLG